MAAGAHGGQAWLVIGVSGVGKTVMAKRLAKHLGAAFLDADDFHPPANVRAMSEGRPLDDAMRAPWLDNCAEALEAHRRRGDVVMACSALKRIYRDRLRARVGRLGTVYLAASFEVVKERMSRRRGHYMPVELLQSQFDALEPPGPDERVVEVDAEKPIEAVAAEMFAKVAPAARG